MQENSYQDNKKEWRNPQYKEIEVKETEGPGGDGEDLETLGS